MLKELELAGANGYQTVYINLSMCIATYPCHHYVRYADGSSDELDSNQIIELFTERGLPKHPHFEAVSPLLFE